MGKIRVESIVTTVDLLYFWSWSKDQDRRGALAVEGREHQERRKTKATFTLSDKIGNSQKAIIGVEYYVRYWGAIKEKYLEM